MNTFFHNISSTVPKSVYRTIQMISKWKHFYRIKRQLGTTLKLAAANTSFPSLYIIDTVIAGRPFFIQLYRYPEVCCNRHLAVFFETSVLKEVRILCLLSQQ